MLQGKSLNIGKEWPMGSPWERRLKDKERDTGDTEAGQRVAFSASGVGGNAKIGIRFYGKGSSELKVSTGVFI